MIERVLLDAGDNISLPSELTAQNELRIQITAYETSNPEKEKWVTISPQFVFVAYSKSPITDAITSMADYKLKMTGKPLAVSDILDYLSAWEEGVTKDEGFGRYQSRSIADAMPIEDAIIDAAIDGGVYDLED